MRAATAQEITDLGAFDNQKRRWLFIEDASGVMVEWTDRNGLDWLGDVERVQHVERGIMQMTFRLTRQRYDPSTDATVSVAPEMTTEIQAGRKVQLYVAVAAQSLDPIPASRRKLAFEGWIDRHGVASTDQWAEFTARDRGGRAKLTSITGQLNRYGNAAGTTQVETVVQDLLDNHGTNFDTAPSVYAPTSSGVGVYRYTQGRMDLWDAIQEVVALSADDFRWDWHPSTDAIVPYFRQIDRTDTTAVATLSADDYHEVPSFEEDAGLVHNAIEVIYNRDTALEPGDAGYEDTYTASDATSQTTYGFARTRTLDSADDPWITSSAEAKALGDKVLADESYPPAVARVEGPFNWRYQLFDILDLSSNSVLWSSTQQMTVMAIRDLIPQDPEAEWTTTLDLRHQPAGNVTRWHVREARRRNRDHVADVGITQAVKDGIPSELDSATEQPQIGFGAQGHPQITLSGHSGVVGLLATLAVDGTATTVAEDASTTTSAAITAGDGSVAVAAASGYAGYWCSITDGAGTAETMYCDAHSGSTFSIDNTFQNDYPSGSTVRRFVVRTTHSAGGIRANHGIFTADGTVPQPNVTAEVGEAVEVLAASIKSDGTVGNLVRARKQRADKDYEIPKLGVQGTESSGSVLIDWALSDKSLAATALEYKRRDGSDQSLDGAWQTSFDTSSGTFGTNQSCTRSVTFSDPYIAIVWRLRGRDENGDTVTLFRDTIEFADIQTLEKTITLGSGDLQPRHETTPWLRYIHAGEGLILETNDTSGTSWEYTARLPVVRGTVLTEIRFRVRGSGGTGQVASQVLTTGSLLANDTYTATTWTTRTATLNETVGTAPYSLRFYLIDSGGGPFGTAVGKVELDYSMPSYKQTY